LARGQSAGFRNAQVTVLAPTGTIAFLMDCDTTGVEPDIALVKYKLLAGGGMLKIVNRGVPDALRRLGYSQPQVEAIVNHIEKFDTIEDVQEERAAGVPPAGLRKEESAAGVPQNACCTVTSGLKPEHLPIFDCAFKAYRGRRSIHYMA